ncbi:hypothetical protein, partial [Acidocella facilis]|uniref:hypothetical protein n=1 Tax=Acidocella facilis TaxID=525 RepID=UPI001F25198F
PDQGHAPQQKKSFKLCQGLHQFSQKMSKLTDDGRNEPKILHYSKRQSCPAALTRTLLRQFQYVYH